jgi:hypothetical protein
MQSTYKSADPSLAFDALGNLFLSYIDYRESPDSGGVYVSKSTNGGITWTPPVKAIDAYADGMEKPIDRPWLAVDPSGTRLFLTTKPPPWVTAPNRPYLVTSANAGLNWSAWRYVDTTNFLVGNIIAQPMAAVAFAGNSTMHCIYPSYLPSQSVFARYIHASSATMGADLSHHVVINSTGGVTNDSAKLGYCLTADPSDSNHLVFVYPFGPAGTDIDIMMVETFNGGINWTSPMRVNDDAIGNGKLQDLVWAAFDEDGDFIVSWRDRRNAPGVGYATASEIFYAFRDKDSLSFGSNKVITDSIVAYHTILSQNGNDFMGLALSNDTLSAAWANTRDGSLDVWFARIPVKSGTLSLLTQVDGHGEQLKLFPNPAEEKITIAIPQEDLAFDLQIFSSDMRCVLHKLVLAGTTQLDVSALLPGHYTMLVESKKSSYIRSFIIKN